MNNMNYDTFCDLFNISKARYSQSGVKNPTKATIQFSSSLKVLFLQSLQEKG